MTTSIFFLYPMKKQVSLFQVFFISLIDFVVDAFGFDVVYLPVRIGSYFETYLIEIIFPISSILFSVFRKMRGLAI